MYIVATPIGHLGDLSPRAAETLRTADFIAAEDTRVTSKLLNHLGIKKPLVSYYQHNMRESGAAIMDRITAGESCALCADAGTPAISDPGELLVKAAIESGITVIPIPGPCAAITALCASGLITGRFCFEGFLPMARKRRAERLAALSGETRTIIFYEAPHKLINALRDLLAALGDREISIARELSKLHEEMIKTTLSEAMNLYTTREPKGEYVLVIAGCPEPEPPEIDDEEALELVESFVARGLTLSEACRRAAEQCGRKRSELYRLALKNRQA